MSCHDNENCVDLPCPNSTGTVINSTCGCGQNCGCTPATPTPFYQQAHGCEESHKQVIIQNQYATGITTATAFNMPACGSQATVVFPGLQVISLGSYLWNPLFGFLKVVSFDYANSSVILENECSDGNAAPGTAIPSCTVFTVTSTPVGVDNPCLNAEVANGSLLVCKNGTVQPLDATAVGQVPVSTNAGSNEVEFQTVDIQVRECTALTGNFTVIMGNVGPYTINVLDSTIFTPGAIIQFGNLGYRLEVISCPTPLTIQATIVSGVPAAMEVIPTDTPVCWSSCCDQIQKTLDDPCSWDLSARQGIWTSETWSVAVAFQATGTPIAAGALHQFNTATSPTIKNTTCRTATVLTRLKLRIQGYTDCDPNPAVNPFGATNWDGSMYQYCLQPELAYGQGAIGTAVPGVPVPMEQLFNWKMSAAGGHSSLGGPFTVGSTGIPITAQDITHYAEFYAAIAPGNELIVTASGSFWLEQAWLGTEAENGFYAVNAYVIMTCQAIAI